MDIRKLQKMVGMYVKVDWRQYFDENTSPAVQSYITKNADSLYPWLYDIIKHAISKKLDEVNLNIVNLINDLNRVGSDIVNSIYDLSYITEESTKQITSKLDDIDSTLKFGNLINIIQTYQTYKINQNTKSLK